VKRDARAAERRPSDTGFDGATTLECPTNAPREADLPRVVVVGASTAAAIGRVFVVEDGAWIVGRSADADLRLDDPGISRRHAKLVRRRSGACKVVDLRSTNGTYVNGVRVRSATLREGDRIRIGSATAIRFARSGELDADEERLRQALAAAGVGTWEWDARSGRMSFSEGAARLLRLEPDAAGAPPQDAWTVVHADDRARLEDGLARVAETGAPYDAECRVVGPGGERWVALRGELLRDEGSRPVRIAGVVMDVTDLRREAEVLRRQALVLESLYDGVVVLRRDGAVADCNASAERMMGVARTDAAGRALGAVLRPGEPDALTPALVVALARTGRWSAEVDVRRADGGELATEVVAVPLRDAEGAPTGAVALLRDVTARKRLEGRVLLSDRLASLGTLSAGLAHEINNPLAFVVASVAHAARELESGAALDGTRREDVLRALRDAQDGAGRIGALVRDLGAFARPQEAPGIGPVDVNRVLGLALRMARNELAHRARVVTALAEVPPVAASESRLAQLFVNLLVNAAQAIPEGAAAANEVRITTRVHDGGRVAVEIADTGGGIAPEHLARIFDPFFTTKHAGGGTGLGLSICHGIVTSLGGEIRVDSAPGKGSRFLVLLPVDARPAPPQPLAGEPPRAPRRARILVVDDEPLIGSAIERLLSRRHDVTKLVAAEDALRVLARDPGFDVILCDVMMPELSGPEFHARLSPELARRVVFMSGGAFTDASRSFLAHTENPKLAKPLDLAELERVIGRLLDRPA
jgi:PAS domain S-box-containing protein